MLTENDLAEMEIFPCRADVPVLVAEVRRLRAESAKKDVEIQVCQDVCPACGHLIVREVLTRR